MRELPLAGVKVGDKLFVKKGIYDKGVIVTANRITPSGRVITDIGEFNSDGWQRGGSRWHRFQARPATEDDIAGVNRYRLAQDLGNFQRWEDLGADDLKAAAAIIAKYKAKP